jgi:hypothetical protein
MSSDKYLQDILKKYEVNVGGAQAAANSIYPVISQWGGEYLKSAEFSGSLAKGTAVSNGADADVFLSLSSTTPNTLKEIYDSLHSKMTAAGYNARRQNVSIGLQVNGYSIDLVPGKRQSQFGNDHSLYRSKADSWTKTNVATHISHISNSGRTDEIRVLKIWRNQRSLDIPSFLLELAVIDGLKFARRGNLAENVWNALDFLAKNIQTKRYVDPANTNNVISDDCSSQDKALVAAKAAESRNKRTWEEIVW